MTTPALVTAALALLGIFLLILAIRIRRSCGLGGVETVALDDLTLFSVRHNLAGRPDRIVKQGNTYIPEEWKSSKYVSHGHWYSASNSGSPALLVEVFPSRTPWRF